MIIKTKNLIKEKLTEMEKEFDFVFVYDKYDDEVIAIKRDDIITLSYKDIKDSYGNPVDWEFEDEAALEQPYGTGIEYFNGSNWRTIVFDTYDPHMGDPDTARYQIIEDPEETEKYRQILLDAIHNGVWKEVLGAVACVVDGYVVSQSYWAGDFGDYVIAEIDK